MSSGKAFAQRFGDSPLAFQMKRYEHKSDDAVWLFSVTRYCHGQELVSTVATRKTLMAMRSFIDQALNHLGEDEPKP